MWININVHKQKMAYRPVENPQIKFFNPINKNYSELSVQLT